MWGIPVTTGTNSSTTQFTVNSGIPASSGAYADLSTDDLNLRVAMVMEPEPHWSSFVVNPGQISAGRAWVNQRYVGLIRVEASVIARDFCHDPAAWSDLIAIHQIGLERVFTGWRYGCNGLWNAATYDSPGMAVVIGYLETLATRIHYA